MQKIWLIQSRYDTRVIKKEKEFLKFLQMHSKSGANFKIKIFTLSEEYDDSKSYFDSFITQKERDEQLKTLLEDDSVIATIQKINVLISEHMELNKKSHENSSFKKYLQDIKLLELNQKSFKEVIVSDSCIRRAFLYHGPPTIEWYKTILSIHNFLFEEEYKVGRNMVKVTQERIDNFREAKKQLKSEKKSKK
jgi:anion-transporting  ArsA/GET3 family ATPase